MKKLHPSLLLGTSSITTPATLAAGKMGRRPVASMKARREGASAHRETRLAEQG